jgi:hypothetical protein
LRPGQPRPQPIQPPSAAAKYGTTDQWLQTATKEVAEFAALLPAPQQQIAGRKAITDILRDEFRQVESRFVFLDKLIVQFQLTDPGRALIGAYFASRNIIDRGKGPSAPPSTPPSS